MPVVTMPDGTAVMMPDQIDPALGARLRALQSSYKSTPAPQPTTLEGVSDIAESGVENIPHAAAAAAVDLYRRLSGGDTSAPEPPIVSALRMPMGGAGKALVNKITSAKLPGDEGSGDVNEAAGFGMDPTLKSLVGGTGAVAGDVGALAGAGAVAKNLVTGGADAAATSGPYGMRTGAENPVARNVAGSSARPATAAHNQAIADPVLGAQAGVPPGTKLTPQTLEAAREAPDSVYQRGEASIPPGLLSPAATQAVQGVGADDMIVHSPDTQATIDAQKARLLSGPLTGSQVVNAQKALRFNGFKNIGSEDPEQLALGQAQLKMSDALHQHMVDTLPPNAPVSADQLQAARTALAQNHTIENVLGPNGNVDLAKLAKIHNDNPGMLTGPMRDIAQFASDHPEVTRLPSDAERFNPSGLAKDVASIDLKRPISYVQPFFGPLARWMLTGGAEAPRVPVTGAGGEFGPIDRTPQPPAGMTATPLTAPPPAAAGPPGQIPLADLLSHGVEQPPAPGLQSGPMGTPAPSGMPFQGTPEVVGTQVVKGGAPPFVSQGRFINDQHVEGPETPSSRLVPGTLDELLNGPPRSYGGQPPSNADVPGVMSQGVPEDILQRSRPSGGPSMPVAHSPAFISNNASAESAASQEAINRGTKPLVEVDPDGNERPILRDVTQADVNPARGHLIVDKETGTIVNSGGMAPALARGLLNRWKSMQGSLGGAF
jgi:hypothetical protein